MDNTHYNSLYTGEVTHWWYRVRREIVIALLSPIVANKKEPLRILEIGCGTGELLKEIGHLGKVQGVDISPIAIEYCKARGLTNVMIGDAAQLPFPDESFDVIIALDVIEHLENDSAGCNELKRVLSPGGTAIIAVPAFMFLWGITDVVSHHFRRYTRKQIVARMRETGFTIKRATYFNTFLFFPIAFVRIFVRMMNIPMRSENAITGSFANAILYRIFKLESVLLRYTSFPFGVSVLVTVTK